MLMSSDCFHLIHKHCLSEAVFVQVKQKKSQIICPKQGCNMPLQDWELRENMGSDYEEL